MTPSNRIRIRSPGLRVDGTKQSVTEPDASDPMAGVRATAVHNRWIAIEPGKFVGAAAVLYAAIIFLLATKASVPGFHWYGLLLACWGAMLTVLSFLSGLHHPADSPVSPQTIGAAVLWSALGSLATYPLLPLADRIEPSWVSTRSYATPIGGCMILALLSVGFCLAFLLGRGIASLRGRPHSSRVQTHPPGVGR